MHHELFEEVQCREVIECVKTLTHISPSPPGQTIEGQIITVDDK